TKLVTKTLAPKPLSSESLVPETFSLAIRPLTNETLFPVICPLTNETLSPAIRPHTDSTITYYRSNSHILLHSQQPYSATQCYMNSYKI
ncbi:4851_t:CDS:1, partial [Gigaspora margarita]